jgi:large subunit ribosomal protein L2
MTSQDNDKLAKTRPVRSLTKSLKQSRGRNNSGRITTRHKGGGSRRQYRQLSVSLPDGFKGKVIQIEYDPNRSARIARVKSEVGTYHYIIAANKMQTGQIIHAGNESPVDSGNRMALSKIPLGSLIHAIELVPGRGAQLVRSAGTDAQLVARDEKNAQVRLPSGEVRFISVECCATIGSIGNEQHQNVLIGKAGRNRHKGIRPSVRGVVMNAVDHPHGGGDGGRHRMAKAPRTPWGQKTLGLKTRHNKSTNKYIVHSRHVGKRR